MSDWLELRAGPLAMAFDPEWAFLRRIRLGDREVIRCIYGAVRDEGWGTVAPAVSNVSLEEFQDGFRLSFDAECRRGGIDFFWQGIITGEAVGMVTYEMKGVARSTFLRRRIGLCVLHPIRECAGRPCVIERPDGSAEESRFPLSISPHQPFLGVRAIVYEIVPGLRVETRCEGETFETEDQRNWTDASFKTYCPPLALPSPSEIREGETLDQTVIVALHGDVPAGAAEPARRGPVSLVVGEGPWGPLPRIGLSVASHGRPLGPREQGRLRELSLSHLRVDLRPSEEGWRDAAARAAAEAAALGAALEPAVHLSDAAEGELAAVRDEIERLQPKVARWLVLSLKHGATPPELVALARRFLTGAKVGGGTAGSFVELNRSRPPAGAFDFACYALTPQVHTFDEASMAESLEGQAWTLRTAREFLGDLPLAIGPVTLKPRRRGGESEAGELPPGVDPRQASLFAAAWTLGCLGVLAAGGVGSVTFYETTGWLGVMETERGSPLHGKFPSRAGCVFPVYHVLAAVGDFAGGEALPLAPSDETRIVGLALRKSGRQRVLLANLTDEEQQVALRNLSGFLSLRRLDGSNEAAAARAPEVFRSKVGEMVTARGPQLELALPAYGFVQIDTGR